MTFIRNFLSNLSLHYFPLYLHLFFRIVITLQSTGKGSEPLKDNYPKCRQVVGKFHFCIVSCYLRNMSWYPTEKITLNSLNFEDQLENPPSLLLEIGKTAISTKIIPQIKKCVGGLLLISGNFVTVIFWIIFFKCPFLFSCC